MKHVLIICLAISAFIGVSLASTTVLPTATALNLQNSTSISQGQATAFLNGTIKFTNVTTIYKPPSVGNIKKLSSSTWGVITFVDVISTYPNNVPLSDIYFKALTNNPSNIEIYELNTTSQIVDEANTFITGTKLISTDNGTLSENIYNTITTPTQVNTSVWANLSDSNVIIKPGINEFEITGSGNAGTTYDWEYSISTANLISPVAAIGSGLKLKNAPVTSISFDPTWTVPSSVIAWFNYTVVNNDGTNSIPVGSTLNITVNAVQYSAYANNAFTNWVVFNGYTGNILYSWMQGNVANGIQTSGLNTISFGVSANAPNDIIANGLLFDINTDFSVAAGATDNNAFALGFYSMATNSMNGNNIGEAPQLTCANGANLGTCGTYGKYDDGANVFDVFYSNFSTSALTNWNTPSSLAETYTVENQLILSKPGSGGGLFGLESKKSFTSVPFQVQGLFGSFSSSGGSPTVCLGETSGTVAGGQTICGYAYTSGTNAGGYYVGLQTTTQSTFDRVSSLGATALIKPAVVTPPTNLTEIVNWLGTGVETGYIQYGGSNAGDGGSGWTFNTFSFIDIGESGGSFSASGNFFYVDAFKSFYKNPTITNGIVQTASGATCSFTVSNSFINFGTISNGQQDATSGTVWNSILVMNTGSSSSPIYLSGSNWAYISNTFNPTNTVFSFSSGVAWASANQVQSTSTSSGYTVLGSGTKNLYFGLAIPLLQPGGTYSESLTIGSLC